MYKKTMNRIRALIKALEAAGVLLRISLKVNARFAPL
jgi:hypothetical protein